MGISKEEFTRIREIIKEHWNDERNLERLIHTNIDLQEISYEQVKELIDIIDPWVGFYLVIPTFIDKKNLKETEEIELARYLLKNCYTDMCMNYASRYLIDAKAIISEVVRNNGKHIKYNKQTDERIYILLNECLNKRSDSKKIDDSYNHVVRLVLMTILDTDIYDKDRVEELISREDIILHLFTDDNLNYDVIERERRSKGLYTNYCEIKFTENDLDKIYGKYSDYIITKQNKNYSNVYMLFIKHRDEEEIREFIEQALESENMYVINAAYVNDKINNFLDRNTDLKEKIDAVMIMDRLNVGNQERDKYEY